MERKFTHILVALFLCSTAVAGAQDCHSRLTYSGQFSSVAQGGHAHQSLFSAEGRYLPQLSWELPCGKQGLFDVEGAAHLYGSVGTVGREVYHRGRIRPYRAWLRYSNERMELRMGLQKINFGSAQLLRPLMWFDALDPRDPLQLTEGVWAGLFRYYWKNNANLWLWGLTGNDETKGWELTPNRTRYSPEFGGRLQLPVPRGEAALTLHYRESTRIPQAGPEVAVPTFRETDEYRIGLDAKIDVGVGLSMESTYQRMGRKVGPLQNQIAFTGGLDYTFGVGNGLGLNVEHLFTAFGEHHFAQAQRSNLTALMLTYPLGVSDMLTFIGMYDWENHRGYSFAGWRKDFDHVSIYLNAYANPRTSAYTVRQQSLEGWGLQFIFQWNHSVEKVITRH